MLVLHLVKLQKLASPILVEHFFLFSLLLHFALAICCAIVRNGPYFSLYGVSNLHKSSKSRKYICDTFWNIEWYNTRRTLYFHSYSFIKI